MDTEIRKEENVYIPYVTGQSDLSQIADFGMVYVCVSHPAYLCIVLFLPFPAVSVTIAEKPESLFHMIMYVSLMTGMIIF